MMALHLDLNDKNLIEALQSEAEKHDLASQWLAWMLIRITLARGGYDTMPTPDEIMSMTDAQRNFILEMSAIFAEDDYRNDPELTAFKAYEILDYDDYITDDTDHS